ncbi:MAG: pitrilysin family protein [Gammaproteobacteria bacterium]|nr:pitrilysin family protein [Gammaproteobacteria bacterium]MDD9896981.1 pitrilysin family protein [Gammaproteobacteria bacterium]MDD9958429.1 pitrilysin family protein [Gammaproteobacteria bacterium]
MQRLAIALLVLFSFSTTPSILAQSTDFPDIPFEKFVLDNGLTLIVHEDRKAPIVSVNIWYHVGSKNEPAGKSGFAHLFEHLMFNGSENFNDDYFQVLERVGATDLNGTTNLDRTNYFQNVPRNALDQVLWMESDRMGHLLGAVDQAKLDEQRGVVQNEKRQGENQPYGKVFTAILESVFPYGHPYAHSVIGSMEDLNAASLEDVQEWFQTYYGPNNAVVVIAGDITSEEALAKTEQYFGDIPPSPPIAKHAEWIAKRTGEQRQIMQDRVPQARIYKVWNIPHSLATDTNLLDLFASILADGKNSRLYNRLVYRDQIATDVAAFIQAGEIASMFIIQATANPADNLEAVEAAIDEEMQQLLTQGPAQEELDRVQTQVRARFIRGIERIGGFGGKSDALARSEVYGGSPDAYRKSLADQQNASVEGIREAANRWLTDGVYVLEVEPFPRYAATGEGVDRSRLPDLETPPDVSFPEIQRARLSNGLNIVLAERNAIPTVGIQLMVNAGYAADQLASPGTASLAMNMLDEGTESLSSLEISEALETLGAVLTTGSNLDTSTVTLNALTENLEPSLALFADVILNPSFPQVELERLKQEQLARIQREQTTPIQMAQRVFPKLIYGADHAYGQGLTGSGTLDSVRNLERSDLMDFVRAWFKPNNATLIVVGNTDLDTLVPMLEEQFADWSPGDVPEKNVSDVAHQQESKIFLIDRPDSLQSVIYAGHIAPAVEDESEIAIGTMNNILGGSFTSRINMNLREDKGWSYGSRTIMIPTNSQRPFFVQAPVQTDRTADSMQEVINELRGFIDDSPPTREEVQKAQDSQSLRLAGRWETNNSVSGSLREIVRFGYEDDYFDRYADRVRSLNIEDVAEAARGVVRPENMVWLVVGDRSRVEAEIKELGIADIEILDADGNPTD